MEKLEELRKCCEEETGKKLLLLPCLRGECDVDTMFLVTNLRGKIGG